MYVSLLVSIMHRSLFHYNRSLTAFLNRWEHVPRIEWTWISCIPLNVPCCFNRRTTFLVPVPRSQRSGNLVTKAHSMVPRFQARTHSGLGQGPGGNLVPTRVQTWSAENWTYLHTLLLPAQAETRCCHVAYCTRDKPTSGTWHDASGLRAPSHSLRIRRAPVHSIDRQHAQSTIRGPRSYSHVTISRAMTHHYSYGNCPSMQHGLRTSWLTLITHA
jgi:hypothetical protein